MVLAIWRNLCICNTVIISEHYLHQLRKQHTEEDPSWRAYNR